MSPLGFAVHRQTFPRTPRDYYYDDYYDYYYDDSLYYQQDYSRPVPIWLCVFLVVSNHSKSSSFRCCDFFSFLFLKILYHKRNCALANKYVIRILKLIYVISAYMEVLPKLFHKRIGLLWIALFRIHANLLSSV